MSHAHENKKPGEEKNQDQDNDFDKLGDFGLEVEAGDKKAALAELAKKGQEEDMKRPYLTPLEINTLINHILNIPVLKDVDAEAKIKFYKKEIAHQPWVIFKSTSDSATKGSAPFITEVISDYKKHNPRSKEKFLIPAIQTGKGGGHIVLVEGDFGTSKTKIHDSQGLSHVLFDGPLINALSAADLKEPEYKAYGKQDKDFECGFFVHQYMQDILFNEGNLLSKIKMIKPQRTAYIEEYARINQNDDAHTRLFHLNRYRNMICEPIVSYLEERFTFHDKRVMDVLHFTQTLAKLSDIKGMLTECKDLFDHPKKDISKNKYFKTSLENDRKGRFYRAVCSALRICHLSVIKELQRLQVPGQAPGPAPGS